MKIRNKKTGVEISSPHIRKGSYDGEDVFLNSDDVFLNENYEELFYIEDGWEEVTEEHLPCTAISLMHYLDDNRAKDKMCLSNGECEQIDKAWWNNDWRAIINYIKKYCYEDKK